MVSRRIAKVMQKGMASRHFDVSGWRPPKAAVHISQPVQLACYTRASQADGGAVVPMSTEGLLRVQAVDLPSDLNEGYPDAFIRKDADGGPTGIEPILASLCQAGHPLSCDVCTFRNNLNKMAMTLLNPKDDWAVDAWQGGTTKALILDILSLPQQDFPGADKFQYYGYKFEALCTGSSTVDATSEFCSIVRLKLGQHSVFMGAEIDACDPDSRGTSSGGLQEYVEMKTYKIPESRSQDLSIKRYKHPRWWMQSFLVGVPYLLLGGRDAQGILRRVDRVRVSDLQRLSSQMGCPWDPNSYLHFLDDVLAWMRACAGEHSEQHLHFEYSGANGRIQFSVADSSTLGDRMKAALS